MKSAVLKLFALGSVALAAYPVVTSLRPDQSSAPHLPEIIRPSSASTLPDQKKVETALSVSPTAPTPNGAGVSVIIRPDTTGHFVTKATINGFQIPLMFDTGASIVALSYEDATKLGLHLMPNDFRSQVKTANGLTQAAEITLKEVRIEGIRIADVPAMVLPPGKLETSLLGQSFWGRLKTGFSYAAGNLILKN